MSEGSSGRNQYPMHNNVGMRILPDANLTKFFVAGGMPVDAALRGRAGHNSWDDSETVLRDPALARSRSWASTKGRVRLVLSSVVKFPYWRDRLYGELPNILRSNGVQAYDNYNTAGRLPSRVAVLGAPATRGELAVWVAAAIAGLALAATDRNRRRLVLFAAAGLFSAAVDFYMSYIGDAMEVNRHLVGPLARLTIMLVIAVALGLDQVAARFSASREPAAVA
jgi:hypothetical protein